MAVPQSEQRAFGLHPAILLTLMREQAGSLDKDMAELVMNSVDAGASRIDLTISEEGFSISDDGRGFTERSQIENFFEIFGTPHKASDAYYGKFRIGRGQVMSYAKTTWRSGPFEMRVDIAGAERDLGYELITHDTSALGCRIDGVFYAETFAHIEAFVPDTHSYVGDRSFLNIIKYVPIPIYINGTVGNKPPMTETWDMEDEFAWYRFRKDTHSAHIFNRGVLVEERSVRIRSRPGAPRGSCKE